MIRFLLTLFGISLIGVVFGQVQGYDFNRSKLKGYKKLMVTRTNYAEADSAMFRSLYFINESGDITRSESYDAKELTSWTRYEYDSNGLLKYTETHNQIFSYDEKTGKNIGEIKPDTYHAELFEYFDDHLIKKFQIFSFEGDKSSDYYVAFEYDKSGRLVKQIHVDDYIGLKGEFEPNSSTLTKLSNKDSSIQWTIVYSYNADSVIETRYDESRQLHGYTFSKLDANQNPISSLDTDSQKMGVKLTTRTFNQLGDLVRETIEIINASKIDYDMAAGDEYQLFYNEKLLPALSITKEKGKVISKVKMQYE